MKNLARILDEPDEIRTEHPRDTSLSVIVIPIYGFLPDFSTSQLQQPAVPKAYALSYKLLDFASRQVNPLKQNVNCVYHLCNIK